MFRFGCDRTDLVTRSRNGRLIWTCRTCKKPIANRTGHVCVDWGAAIRASRAADDRKWAHRKQVEETGNPVRHVTEEDMLRWRIVPWEAFHESCDPNPDRDDYWFPVDACRSLAEFIDWSAHLSEKNWLAHTDWQKVMYALNGADALRGADR